MPNKKPVLSGHGILTELGAIRLGCYDLKGTEVAWDWDGLYPKSSLVSNIYRLGKPVGKWVSWAKTDQEIIIIPDPWDRTES